MVATTKQIVSEISDFLSSNPTPEQVAAYKVSKRSQNRLRRLLAFNQAGLLSKDEHAELEQIEALEHSVTMLKIQALEDVRRRRV
jgi:hypothetical protein